MGDGGKGSKSRPFSVSQDEFDNRWNLIFKKDKDMQIRVKEDQTKFGTCGCGRSPTGKCIGWHGLSGDDYVIKKNEWELSEYKKQAQSLWNDSCTSERSK